MITGQPTNFWEWCRTRLTPKELPLSLVTRNIPHISDDSTSDLACGHYDPLAVMRTVTGVSKPESCRPHTGAHSCAARRSGGAASKKKLKRDKIPLQSSINLCLFFSEMKPNKTRNEGRKGYNSAPRCTTDERASAVPPGQKCALARQASKSRHLYINITHAN